MLPYFAGLFSLKFNFNNGLQILATHLCGTVQVFHYNRNSRFELLDFEAETGDGQLYPPCLTRAHGFPFRD